MGQVYVQVDASVANGIMTMDSSGGGQTGGGYWINWGSNGYSNSGNWFWDDPNNYLQAGWAAAVASGGGFVDGCAGDPSKSDSKHDDSYDSFLVHMTNGHADDLNSVLGAWNKDDKLQFLLTNADQLGGCVTPS